MGAGQRLDVYYGGDGRFFVKAGVSGGIGCGNAVFGDPITGVVKACSYVITDPGVPGNVAPTVALTSPQANGVCAVGNTVTLAANAVGGDSTIAQVEFFDGSTLLGSTTTAPDTLTWTASLGVHGFIGRATDNVGARTGSAIVSIAVNPPGSRTFCAGEGTTCTPPPQRVADVYYGAVDKVVIRRGVTGSIACSNAVFGDPIVGVVKSCSYLPSAGTGP